MLNRFARKKGVFCVQENGRSTSIDAAKASYKKEKTNYINELEDTYTRDIDDAF